MLLRPAQHVPPTAWPAHQQVETALVRAEAHLRDAVLQPLVEDRRRELAASVAYREEFLRKGFDYQEIEFLDARARLREQARAGDQAAARRLEEVRR